MLVPKAASFLRELVSGRTFKVRIIDTKIVQQRMPRIALVADRKHSEVVVKRRHLEHGRPHCVYLAYSVRQTHPCNNASPWRNTKNTGTLAAPRILRGNARMRTNFAHFQAEQDHICLVLLPR